MGSVFHNGQPTETYKDHAITCRASLSADFKHFVPMAIISWKTNGRLIVYFLRPHRECSTGEDANTVALEQAKVWIDHHELDLVKR
jgi:hypothetical protein